jgi:hypothetical protein
MKGIRHPNQCAALAATKLFTTVCGEVFRCAILAGYE